MVTLRRTNSDLREEMFERVLVFPSLLIIRYLHMIDVLLADHDRNLSLKDLQLALVQLLLTTVEALLLSLLLLKQLVDCISTLIQLLLINQYNIYSNTRYLRSINQFIVIINVLHIQSTVALQN